MTNPTLQIVIPRKAMEKIRRIAKAQEESISQTTKRVILEWLDQHYVRGCK